MTWWMGNTTIVPPDPFPGGYVLESPRSRWHESFYRRQETAPDISVQENMRNGIDAMQRALGGKEDVEHAMYRKDIGWISFVWGEPGCAPPEGEDELRRWWASLGSEKERRRAPYRGGYGLSHIVAKRNWEGKWIVPLLGKKGRVVAYELVEAIAKGDMEIRGEARIIYYSPKKLKVILKKKAGRIEKTYWLISSFEVVPAGKYEMRKF